jgi:hypothetical protein
MRTIIVSISLLISTSIVFAYVFGGSNLGITGYPKHTCIKPYKPFQFSSRWEVDSYNAQLDSFISCIRVYVDNAKNDIERIRESANEAIREANSL